MIDTYILGGPDGRTPVRCPLIPWAMWFETADRRVALTEHELFSVSTVFLGIDHQFPAPVLLRWGGRPGWLRARRVQWRAATHVHLRSNRIDGKGPPLLFETMVFADKTLDDIECSRYANWDDAEAGHRATVKRMMERVRQCSPTPTGPKPETASRSPSNSTNPRR